MDKYKKKLVQGAIMGMLSGVVITGGMVTVLGDYQLPEKHKQEEVFDSTFSECPIKLNILEKIEEDCTVYKDIDINKEIKEIIKIKTDRKTVKQESTANSKEGTNGAYKALTVMLGAVGGLTLGHRFAEMNEYEKAEKEKAITPDNENTPDQENEM